VWRRKGLRSVLRDEWEQLDARGITRLVCLYEDNMTQALLRRFLFGKWLPQNYDIITGNQRCADLRQRFNLLRYELNLDFSMDLDRQRLDSRMGIAGSNIISNDRRPPGMRRKSCRPDLFLKDC
jgi:hypothetical protein